MKIQFEITKQNVKHCFVAVFALAITSLVCLYYYLLCRKVGISAIWHGSYNIGQYDAAFGVMIGLSISFSAISFEHLVAYIKKSNSVFIKISLMLLWISVAVPGIVAISKFIWKAPTNVAEHIKTLL